MKIVYKFSKTPINTQTLQEKCHFVHVALADVVLVTSETFEVVEVVETIFSFQVYMYLSHSIKHIPDMQVVKFVHKQQIFKSNFKKNAF